jgi:hypothetical protein
LIPNIGPNGCRSSSLPLLFSFCRSSLPLLLPARLLPVLLPLPRVPPRLLPVVLLPRLVFLQFLLLTRPVGVEAEVERPRVPPRLLPVVLLPRLVLVFLPRLPVVLLPFPRVPPRLLLLPRLVLVFLPVVLLALPRVLLLLLHLVPILPRLVFLRCLLLIRPVGVEAEVERESHLPLPIPLLWIGPISPSRILTLPGLRRHGMKRITMSSVSGVTFARGRYFLRR